AAQINRGSQFLANDLAQERAQLGVRRDVVVREEDRGPARAPEKIRGEEILLVVIALAPPGWIVVRQEDVMNSDEDTGRQARENFEEEHGDVRVHERAMTSIEKQKVARFELSGNFPGYLLERLVDPLVRRVAHIGSWGRVDGEDSGRESERIDGRSGKLRRVSRADLEQPSRALGAQKAAERNRVQPFEVAVVPARLRRRATVPPIHWNGLERSAIGLERPEHARISIPPTPDQRIELRVAGHRMTEPRLRRIRILERRNRRSPRAEGAAHRGDSFDPELHVPLARLVDAPLVSRRPDARRSGNPQVESCGELAPPEPAHEVRLRSHRHVNWEARRSRP